MIAAVQRLATFLASTRDDIARSFWAGMDWLIDG